MFKQFVRHQSTIPQLRRRATFREMLGSPATKSLLLTVVFGSTVTELISRRNKLETLRENHKIKMGILGDIRTRLENGETIDLQKELHLASKVSDVDIDVDEALNEFLRLADEPKDKSELRKEITLVSSGETEGGNDGAESKEVSSKGYI